MNPEVANEVYELLYEEQMAREDFDEKLEQGLTLIAHHPDATKVVISRMYGPEQADAYKIALHYNEQLMIHLLSAE
jgi:hypothetical protein